MPIQQMLLGVGLNGEGTSGSVASGQDGGSGGNPSTGTDPGKFGGGRGTNVYSSSGYGGVRIIWPGADRQFPSTRTADE